MKNLFSLFLVILLATNFLLAQSYLENIESRIEAAFGQSFATNENQLTPIIESLSKSYKEDKNRATAYWMAYACYQSAIYLLNTKQNDLSEAATKEGIAVLESITEKNDEDYILLGSLHSFSITFQPDLAPTISPKANNLVQKGLEINAKNLRGHLALGRSDYYKPAQYGGGKMVEKHLQKALSLKNTYSDDPNAPTWGRDDVYMYMVWFYRRADRNQDALLYCRRGLKEYPNHVVLRNLFASLQ